MAEIYILFSGPVIENSCCHQIANSKYLLLFTDYWDNKISEMCSYQIPAADESIVHNCQNRTVHVYCAQYFISRYC